jgi:tryptophan synthase beta chain
MRRRRERGDLHAFISRKVRLIGVEAGLGRPRGGTARPFAGEGGGPSREQVVRAAGPERQITDAHSISAGLDYPGVGPEHAWLKESGRARYVSVTDGQALHGFDMLSRLEGIQPALESSHAVAYAVALARRMPRSSSVLVNLSGRGDKDMGILMGGRKGER